MFIFSRAFSCPDDARRMRRVFGNRASHGFRRLRQDQGTPGQLGQPAQSARRIVIRVHELRAQAAC